MGGAEVASRLIGLVGLVFLARLLDPEDFGTVALAMVLFSTVKLFSGLGLEPALIHSKIDKSTAAFHVFVVTLVTNVLLFLIVIFSAGFFAELLGDASLSDVLRWLALLILFEGLVLVPRALLRKDMEFGKVGRANVTAEFVYFGGALGLAYLGFGLWSLVYARLASSFTKLVMFWVGSPSLRWLVPRGWNWNAIRDLLRYGGQSAGSGFMSFFNSNWDDWLVGRTLGVGALGFYSRAYRLTNQTIVGINRKVISGVLFPSYSKIQDQPKRVSRVYLKSLGMVALIMTPLALGLFIISGELVPVLLGEKWLPMVPALRIFAVMAFIRPLSGSTAPLFQALGRPNYNLRVGILQTVIMVPLVLVLLSQGISGVAVAVVAAYAVGFLYNVYQVNKVMPGTGGKMLPAILPAAVAGSVMMLGVQISKPTALGLANGQHNEVSIVFMVIVGAVIYGLLALILQRRLIRETTSLVIGSLKRRPKMSLGQQ
jgi:O-antigen/teichoic acid export membrane protein